MFFDYDFMIERGASFVCDFRVLANEACETQLE